MSQIFTHGNERNCETSNSSSPQKTHNGHTKICLLHQYKITSISSIFATQNQLGLAQGSFPAIIIIIIVSRAGTGSAARSSTATASSPTGTRSCTRRRPPAHPQSGRSSTNSQRNRSSLFQIFKKNSYYYYYYFGFPEDLRHLRPVHGWRRPPLLPRLGPSSFGHLADTRFLPLWQLARNLHKIRFAQINRKTTA